MKNNKYMILCVAGQSNAVGYDESPIAEDYLKEFNQNRIHQLGLYEKDNLEVISLGACAQSYQDMRPYGNPTNPIPGQGTKGIHLPLADLLLKAIPEDYEILVISCAYGGCGFTVGEEGSYEEERLSPSPGNLKWGSTSPFYLAMRDRIAYALKLNPENRFLGVVWIQGEHDNADSSAHRKGFEGMTAAFFEYFRELYPERVYKGIWNRSIWYNVETVAYWYHQGQCPQIWEYYREWSPDTYVEIPRDTDSNEVNGTGITASVRACHYGNDAYRKVVAPKTAAKIMERLV